MSDRPDHSQVDTPSTPAAVHQPVKRALSQPVLLAIESSCDETAAAIIGRDLTVLSSVVASQAELHERFGGVVPEIASRAHVERILPVIDDALKQAGVTLSQLTAIAVVTEPGLVGSLLVGLTAAKTLAWTLDIPLISVNHVEAHIYACRLAAGRDLYPAVGLVVSGGHTNLYDCRGATDCRLVGSTIDDAAGEAFDKVASILGLSYPGGPSIEARARNGNAKAFRFPRSFLKDPRLDFSFSGLKTAVLYEAQGMPGSGRPAEPLTEQRVADLSASFQEAVIDVLVEKCRQAVAMFGYRVLCVGGGVAANARFRERLHEMSERDQIEVHLSPKEYCTDNAAMAAIGWELLDAGRTSELDCDVTPGLVRMG
ncbi:MAG: tRNA (adenosine(37)-N6)-threonylcarbamoyltransferase complex transferase subunit TsaD [Planctomycetaceae bacterium]